MCLKFDPSLLMLGHDSSRDPKNEIYETEMKGKDLNGVPKMHINRNVMII